jgi:hypothetical protein
MVRTNGLESHVKTINLVSRPSPAAPAGQ